MGQDLIRIQDSFTDTSCKPLPCHAMRYALCAMLIHIPTHLLRHHTYTPAISVSNGSSPMLDMWRNLA